MTAQDKTAREPPGACCRALLGEGLDLCVRARGLAAMGRREAVLSASKDPEAWEASGDFDRYVARHNAREPDRPIATRSATIHLWVQEQYDRDLAEWERRAKRHLTDGCNQ